MPRFHAGFSVGTVAGALVGTAMVALHIPVTAHLLGVAVLVAAPCRCAVRASCRTTPDPHAAPRTAPARPALARWPEPRTLLVGLVVLAFAFTEGTANDWLGVALIDGYARPPRSARSPSPRSSPP